MRKFVYNILWQLFGVKSIILVDFDGERTLRLLRQYVNGPYYAKRVGLGIHNVVLNSDGTILGRNYEYVTSWEPLYPNKLDT